MRTKNSAPQTPSSTAPPPQSSVSHHYYSPPAGPSYTAYHHTPPHYSSSHGRQSTPPFHPDSGRSYYVPCRSSRCSRPVDIHLISSTHSPGWGSSCHPRSDLLGSSIVSSSRRQSIRFASVHLCTTPRDLPAQGCRGFRSLQWVPR